VTEPFPARRRVTRQHLSRTEGPAWLGFLRVHAAVVRRLEAELQTAHGLSLSAYEALLFLARAPERRLRISDLAGSTLLSVGGSTRLVERLAAEGLVKREQSTQDRREHYAVLTEAGLARLYEANATHLAGVRKYFLSAFTDLELSVMAACWERLLPGASQGNLNLDEPSSDQ
jgi:DNA-binding MarR family transcriptional regulator